MTRSSNPAKTGATPRLNPRTFSFGGTSAIVTSMGLSIGAESR